MRFIGHLPNPAYAHLFSDYLFSQGIHSRVEVEKDGAYALWVFEEDQIERAKSLFDQFNRNPEAVEFRRGAAQADDLRAHEQRQNEAARKRFFEASDIFGPRRGVLTWLLIGLSVAITLLSGWGANRAVAFEFYLIMPLVAQGEVWRLVTPIFLHFSILHLAFDLIWLYDLGTMVEARHGTARYALLILALAIVSNVGQYFSSGPGFGGMSGVVYGLLGYVWLRGKFDPRSGLYLHPLTVAMMIVWFFICLTGYVGHIANYAHGFGLALGMAAGYLSALYATR